MSEARNATRTLAARGAGLVVASLLIAGCQPGTLPCDKDPEWAAICKGDASVTGGGGGSGSGGSSGSGGGTQNSGGSGGGGGGTTAKADTPLDNCSKYKTVGGMDEFFAMRCATSGSCHDAAGGGAWTNFKMPDVWMRLKDAPAKFSCKGDPIIDTKAWDKSAAWRKTRMPAPVMCAGTGLGMSVMPPPLIEPKMMELTSEENACLESFLKKMAGM